MCFIPTAGLPSVTAHHSWRRSLTLIDPDGLREGRAEYKSFPLSSVRASEWCSALFTRAANLLAATSKLYSPVPIEEDNVAVELFEWSATTNSVAIQRLVGNQLLGPLSLAMTSRPEKGEQEKGEGRICSHTSPSFAIPFYHRVSFCPPLPIWLLLISYTLTISLSVRIHCVFSLLLRFKCHYFLT